MNGKAVVVLSNNDGCVVARSNEAKALGIPMGEPLFKIRSLVDNGYVKAFSSNYALYGDMSDRVMQTLSQFTPHIEIYSIDECFLDFSAFFKKDLNAYGRKIKNTVYSWTGIPVSLGIAPTKALAKVANKLAKKSKKANGVLVLAEPRHIEAALKATDIGDVWGIGSQYAKLLRKHGIHTALDFTRLSENWVRRHMSVVGVRLLRELRGESCLELEEVAPPKKGICTSRSFGKRLTEFEDIENATASYAARCAKKLRAQKSCARLLTVFLNTNWFSGRDQQYHASKSIYMPVATNSDMEMIHYAGIALKSIYREGYNYKKSGVFVTDIVPENQVQLALLDSVDREKHRKLMEVMDKLTDRFGRERVKVATQGVDQQWLRRSDMVSRCYTTKLSDIQTVYVL